jgi:hypothetical protein
LRQDEIAQAELLLEYGAMRNDRLFRCAIQNAEESCLLYLTECYLQSCPKPLLWLPDWSFSLCSLVASLPTTIDRMEHSRKPLRFR